MTEIEELESRIRTLSSKDFAKLRNWFIELENEMWDKQIAHDYLSGKFNTLIAKAKAEMAQGQAKEL